MSLRVRFTVIVALVAALGFALPLATGAQLRLPNFNLFGKKQDDSAQREQDNSARRAQDEVSRPEEKKSNSFWNSLNPWAKKKTSESATPRESNLDNAEERNLSQSGAMPVAPPRNPQTFTGRPPERYASQVPLERGIAESPPIPRSTNRPTPPGSHDLLAPNYSAGLPSVADRLHQIRGSDPNGAGLPHASPVNNYLPSPSPPRTAAAHTRARPPVAPTPAESSRRPPSVTASDPEPPRDNGFRARSPDRTGGTNDSENARPQKHMVAVAATGTPSLRVDTRGPQRIVMGEPAEYVIVVRGDENTDARGVSVRIDIPDSVQLVSQAASVGNVVREQAAAKGLHALTWAIDLVPARSTGQLTLTLMPMKPEAFPLAVETVLSPISADPVIDVLVPKVQMTVAIPEEMRAGRTYMCRVTMKNVGEATARDVDLQVAMYDDVQESVAIEPLEPGQEKILEFEVVPQKVGSMDFQVTTRTDHLVLSEDYKQLRVRQPKLEVDATGPRLRFVGTEAVYQVIVRNSGDAVAENLAGAVSLPDGCRLIADVDGDGGHTGRFGWDIGNIAPGEEKTYDIRCQVLSTGEKAAIFSVKGDDGLAAQATTSTRVAAVADLRLSVRQPDGPIPVGEQVVYEFQIKNRGTREAESVQCNISFPDEIEPLQVDGAQAEIQGSRIVVGPISRIGGHDTLVIRVSAQAHQGGNHQFRAELTCPEPQLRLASEGTTLFFDEGSLSATAPSEPLELPRR